MQNLSNSSFEIPNDIFHIHHESIDLEEIVELSNSKSNPFKKQKLDVDGIGKKLEKSYDSTKRF
jgi:hypothetical protein